MIGIGIVGAGYWGEKLLRVFGERADVEVRAVCDPAGERMAALPAAIRRTAHLEELLDGSGIDAVAVATPPSTHFELAQRVLQAGKHCWVEKPLALRATEAHALVDLAAKRNRTLFVDETFLYDPLVQTAKAWIDSGRIGRVFHLSFERLGQGRIRRDSNVWWNSAPHDLSMLCHLVPGRIESVRMEGFSYVQEGIADFTAGSVSMEGGVSAHIYLSWLSPRKVAGMSVTGSHGMLHYEGRFGQRRLSLYRYATADPRAVRDNVVPFEDFALVESLDGGSDEPLALAVVAFLDSIRTGIPAPSAGEYSQRVVEILDAAGL